MSRIMALCLEIGAIATDLRDVVRNLPRWMRTYRPEIFMAFFLLAVGTFLTILLAGFGQ